MRPVSKQALFLVNSWKDVEKYFPEGKLVISDTNKGYLLLNITQSMDTKK